MRLLRQELFFRAKNHVNKLRKYAIYLNQTVDYIEYCSKDEEKREQEVRSLNRVGDSFKKVVVKDNIIPPAR